MSSGIMIMIPDVFVTSQLTNFHADLVVFSLDIR